MIRYGETGTKSGLGFKKVSYDEAVGTAISHGFSYAGVYTVTDDPADLVQNTLIPPFYKRWSAKRNTRKDKNDDIYYALGEDNQYPLFMLDLKAKSGFLQSATEAVADTARGAGATVQADNPEEKALFEKWLIDIEANAEFEDAYFQNAGFFWGAHCELIFGERMLSDTSKKFTLLKVDVPNYIKYRVGVRNPNTGEVEHYWYHPNYYKNRRFDTTKLKGIAKYPGIRAVMEAGQGTVTVFNKSKEEFYKKPDGRKANEVDLSGFGLDRYIVFVKKNSLLSEEYPRTNHETESAINAAILDIFLPQFDVAGMENGLSLGHIVTVPLAKPNRNDPEALADYEDKKRKIRFDIRSRFQGVENAGNVLVLYSDPRSKADPITVAEIPNNNNHETLTEKDERKERTLLTAFRAQHPALLGIPARSGKGLNHQTGTLKEADDLWYLDYVSKIVRLGERLYNDILIPIYLDYVGREVPGLKVTFPRNMRFKHTPSDEVLLGAMTTKQIWKHFELGEYTEADRKVLLRDLADRGKIDTQTLNQLLNFTEESGADLTSTSVPTV